MLVEFKLEGLDPNHATFHTGEEVFINRFTLLMHRRKWDQMDRPTAMVVSIEEVRTDDETDV